MGELGQTLIDLYKARRAFEEGARNAARHVASLAGQLHSVESLASGYEEYSILVTRQGSVLRLEIVNPESAEHILIFTIPGGSPAQIYESVYTTLLASMHVEEK